MIRYLLDTNILSDFISHPHGAVAEALSERRGAKMFTSVIVVFELRFGLAKRGSRKLATRISEVLGLMEIIPVDADLDATYAHLRVALEREGTPIGAHDLLIATQAVAGEFTLVTDNEREFRRVPGLRVENWLRPIPAARRR